MRKSLDQFPLVPINFSIQMNMIDPQWVRNDPFYKDIIIKVQEEMKLYEDELFDNGFI